MQNWDYLWVTLEKNELGKEWQDEIKAKGEDGWELVSVTVFEDQFYFFFKKPLVEPKRKVPFAVA